MTTRTIRHGRLINVNPAELVVEKPVVRKNLEMEVWSQEEVLVAREAGVQTEAFYRLAV